MEPMETRSLLLRGIARVLNAGGSALVDVYDTATSIKTGLLPGERGKLKSLIREYEKKVERLYYEIGKEVALGEDSAQMSAVAEAGIKLVAEYRVKIERIERSVRDIEEKEKAAAKPVVDRAGAKAEPAADAGEPASSEAPVAGEVSPGVAMEEEIERVADAAESAEPEVGEAPAAAETDQSGAPVAGESSLGAETKQEEAIEALEEMLKGDLLKLCVDRGIDADQRMTKAAIIELIKKG